MKTILSLVMIASALVSVNLFAQDKEGEQRVVACEKIAQDQTEETVGQGQSVDNAQVGSGRQ